MRARRHGPLARQVLPGASGGLGFRFGLIGGGGIGGSPSGPTTVNGRLGMGPSDWLRAPGGSGLCDIGGFFGIAIPSSITA